MTNKILLGQLNNAIEKVGSPLLVETPLFIGQIYVDTTEGQEVAYISIGLTSSDWKTISMDDLGSSDGGSVDWTNILNKPNLSTVATSGNYNDLTNKPSIPVTDNNYTNAEKNKLAGLSNYTLPKASDTVLGGVKIGYNLTIDENGVLSAMSNDGSGVSSNADTLDGKHATDFVLTTDTRLSDSRPASDVSLWAKQSTKPSYTKSEIGLGNVDNTSDANKPISTAQQTALNLKEDKASKGLPNGYVGLDENAKINPAFLPSYVDDVLEFTNLVSFPATGETGKIYVALDTNKTYRWGGSSYTAIASGSVDSVNGKTGVVTLVKSDIGLGNVDNTADNVKNVLSATKLTTPRLINGVVFDGTADITITSTGNSSGILKVKDFGAIGDGVADDTVAIQNAINAINTQGGGELRFSKGTYLITSQLTGCSNIILVGENATIKAGNTRIASALIKFTQCSNIQVNGGFTFDMNMQNLPLYVVGDYDNIYNCGIHLEQCADVYIEKNIFKNLYTRGIYAHACSGALSIEKNRFYSPVQSQNQMMEHISIITFNGKIDINKNIFDNEPQSNPNFGVSAMCLSGTHGQADITKNKFNYCGRNNSGAHRLYCIDLYGDTENINIVDNISNNTIWGFANLDGSKNSVVKNNKIYLYIAGDSGTIIVSTITPYKTGNITIEDNKLIALGAMVAYGITFGSTDWGINENNSKIINNVFEGIRHPITVYGAITDLLIDGNILKHSAQQSVAFGIVVKTNSGVQNEVVGTQANSKFDRIKITNNFIECAGGNSLNIDCTNYTGTKGTVIVNRNVINGGGNAIGIITDGLVATVTDNIIKSTNIALYIRNANYGYVRRNLIYTASTALDHSTIWTTCYKSENYYNDLLMT